MYNSHNGLGPKYIADILTEYKPNRPTQIIRIESVSYKYQGFTQNKGSSLLAIMLPTVGTSFQKRSDVQKH